MAVLVGLSLLLAACTAHGGPTSTREQPRGSDNDASDNAPEETEARRDLTMYTDDTPTASQDELRARAQSTNDLRWLPASTAASVLGAALAGDRRSVLAERMQAAEARDVARLARANAVLASEAFARASSVVTRWLDRRDAATGLLATARPQEGITGWFYKDTGSDLFPHLAIGARLLAPNRFPEVLAILEAERRLARRPPVLPDDLVLPDGHPAGRSPGERTFNAAEYAKDGLLPLLEELGPFPWLDRLREISDSILDSAATPSKRGAIPAPSNEVNGDVLQVLVRAYWATGDERYYEAADRIGTAYLEDMLPKTEWLPVHEWDFVDGEPIGRRRLRLSDHGNEIIAGLVGWHLAESIRNEPEAAAHRHAIRNMLDRMLDKGRSPAGLWYRVMEIPSGKVDQEGLSDNWAYLSQAYLLQAIIERSSPDGDVARAERYEESARAALRALPAHAYYPWQRGEMDGYADSIEGAIYLLSRLPDPAAERWVDEQIAVLYGFQSPDGSVLDDYLDGNFVRTVLLYGLSLTQGLWIEPWHPAVALGAARDNGCLAIALAGGVAWSGRLHFDRPRHRDYLNLPIDFPRLNEWPEQFTAQPGQRYVVEGPGGSAETRTGDELVAGLPVSIIPGRAIQIRVCPASP